MILVSACLCGLRCRYNASVKPDDEIIRLVREGAAVPVCPEQLGGLATPRPPAEIRQGDGADVLLGAARVFNAQGEDVTGAFLLGAEETLRLARICGAERAILKAKSPSCGCGVIYDGTFSGTTRPGDGVTAALLRRSGLQVEAI